MSQEKPQVVIPFTRKPKHSWFVILFFVVIYGILLWTAIAEVLPWPYVVLIGIYILFFPIGIFLILAGAKVTADTTYVSICVWGLPLKRIPTQNIKTLIFSNSNNRRRLGPMLGLSTKTPAELEARGKQVLEKMPFVRSELRFMTARPDWNDICLGAGLGAGYLSKDSIWVEYSPDRQQLLESLFPQCPLRISKNYSDPPTPSVVESSCRNGD